MFTDGWIQHCPLSGQHSRMNPAASRIDRSLVGLPIISYMSLDFSWQFVADDEQTFTISLWSTQRAPVTNYQHFRERPKDHGESPAGLHRLQQSGRRTACNNASLPPSSKGHEEAVFPSAETEDRRRRCCFGGQDPCHGMAIPFRFDIDWHKLHDYCCLLQERLCGVFQDCYH